MAASFAALARIAHCAIRDQAIKSAKPAPDFATLNPGYLCYTAAMKTKLLNQALERVESWPADAQDQLAAIALDIDAGLKDVVDEPTDEELEGIDRGLRDAADGRFVTNAEVEAAFAKFRRKQ